MPGSCVNTACNRMVAKNAVLVAQAEPLHPLFIKFFDQLRFPTGAGTIFTISRPQKSCRNSI